MREKPYFCIHILHISIEIRKPYELDYYELDYSDCCRIL